MTRSPSSSGPVTSAGWVARLRQVDALRARAFATRDVALLAQVYASESLRRADSALLRRLVPPKCGLVGATTRYTQVRVRVSDARHATVTARASLPASTLRCPGRPSRRAAAVGAATLTVGLLRTDGGVRIATQHVAWA